MSYSSYPYPDAVNLSGEKDSYGYRMTAEIVKCQQSTPGEIFVYLNNCGWTCTKSDPNTSEDLFQPPTDRRYPDPYHYYRWYEALAIEHYMLLTIGGHE